MLPAMRRGLSSRWRTIKLTPAPSSSSSSQMKNNNEIIESNYPEEINEQIPIDNKGYLGLSYQENLKVYPGSNNGSNSPQQQLQLQQQKAEQATNEKHAGDSFELDELFDLNGETFWFFKFIYKILFFFIEFENGINLLIFVLFCRRDWEAAGGDPDEYFKETLPNYGLVSTLFMTISIPSSIYPPSFNFQQHPPSKHLVFVSLYVRIPFLLLVLYCNKMTLNSQLDFLGNFYVYYNNDFTYFNIISNWNSSTIC